MPDQRPSQSRRDSRDGDAIRFCEACQAETGHKVLKHGLRCIACGYCAEGDSSCDHIWMHYEAGEDAGALLGAPEGTHTFSEPVFVCTLCSLIQSEELHDAA